MSFKTGRLLAMTLVVSLLTHMQIAQIGFAAPKAQIAFTSNRDGNTEIYVMDGDGRNQKRLTINPTNDGDPAWSPDGTKIAFVSNRNGGFIQIYVMDADGTHLNRLTDGLWADDPDWSPDGQKIAFTSRNAAGRAHIAVMDADGHNVFKLTDGQKPSWSPDGQRLVFEFWDGANQIFMINANGQGFKKVTGDLADKRSPAWSPDGLRIAYESWHDGFFHIYVMESSGKNPKRLTHNQAHNMGPAWSPDGQTIAYVLSNGFNAGARQEIHLMTAEGEHLRQLSEVHDGIDFDPDFGAAELAVFPASNSMATWGEIKVPASVRR